MSYAILPQSYTYVAQLPAATRVNCDERHPDLYSCVCSCEKGHSGPHWDTYLGVIWDQEPQTQRLLPGPRCECGAEKDAPSNATHYGWCPKSSVG